MTTDQEKRFEELALLDKLDQLEKLIGGLSEERMDELEGLFPNQVARLLPLLLALRPRIEAADPLLLSPRVVNETGERLASLINGFVIFGDEGSGPLVNNLADWTEGLIELLPGWPAGPELPSTDVRNTAKKFRQSAGQQLRGLKKDFDKVKDEVVEFEEGLETRTGQWGEEKTELEVRIRELQATIDQQRTRLDTAIENYQGQFSEEQARRNEEYRQLVKEVEDETKALEQSVNGAIGDTIRQAEERTKETLTELQAELTKAQDITGYIGATGTAAGYGKEADSQKKIADDLRYGAIGFGVLAAGFAVWAILHAEGEKNPSLTIVVAKALGSVIFAGLAGYVATQSAHHRMREEQARKRELDLVALPAFIATLPEEEKEEITGQVATKLFLTQTAGPPTAGTSEPALTKESITILKLLLDTLGRR